MIYGESASIEFAKIFWIFTPYFVNKSAGI